MSKRMGCNGLTDTGKTAGLLALAQFDADDHPLAVDVRRFQVDGLGDAQTCGIAGGQNRSLFRVADTAEKLQDFSGLRTTGSFCGFFGAGMTSSKGHSLLSETL